jgi:hypothetical protein
VDLDQRVVDIEQRIPLGADHAVERIRLSSAGEQTGEPRQRDQEPRGDRVELPDVTEGEAAQERSQRRRCVVAGKDPAHPSVPQQRHVIDGVRTSDHPSDQ